MYRIQVSKKVNTQCPETNQFFEELNQEGGLSFNPDGSMKVILFSDEIGNPVYEYGDAVKVAYKARSMYNDFLYTDMYGIVIEVFKGETKLATLDTYKRTVTNHRPLSAEQTSL